jgi:hypothetical protein
MEAEIQSILTEAVRERTEAPGLAQALLVAETVEVCGVPGGQGGRG